jgi:hypothetical protein
MCGICNSCRLACGPPIDLSEFQYAAWVPSVLRTRVQAWLERFFATIGKELLVGQVGILHGSPGLPLQEQHRDHQDHHLVFLLRSAHNIDRRSATLVPNMNRLAGHKCPTLFSSRPPVDRSYLEYYHNLFELPVQRGDALVFDGSMPHGQGPIIDEDTWTIFVTLHLRGTFQQGFPNETLTHSTYIYRTLTQNGKTWGQEDITHLLEHPIVLQQV